MNSTIHGITKRIKRLGFHIPFTIYFVVFLIAVLLSRQWLIAGQFDNGSAFADIFALLLKMAFFFATALLSVALLSVFIAWGYFLYSRSKKELFFSLQTDLKENEISRKQTVRLKIKPILKPFLGFVKLRLIYDESSFSEKFLLLENDRKRLFSTTIEGIYHWKLPQIKEYRVDKAILYFEDIFQFFSIAVSVPAGNHFFTHPTATNGKDLNILPRKTQDTSTRIDQIRKVEGEYLNYKNFENNDDVRRIVWKIYAKNKELVVRIPEIMDPYASHLYLYASFYSSFPVNGNEVVDIPFLNYYKVAIWSAYHSLVKRGLEVKFIPDQDITGINVADPQRWVKYCISKSAWHTKKDLKTYINTSDASLVIISSLSDYNDVRQLVEAHSGSVTFLLVKLSDSFRSQNIIDWVEWLFIKTAGNDIDKYKRNWSLSPLSSKLKENERQLEKLLAKYYTMLQDQP